MLTIIEGPVRSGKTTVLLHMLEYELGRGRTAVCHGIDFSEYHVMETFSLAECMSYVGDPNRYAFFFDEAYRFMDCRSTLSRANRMFSYFVAHHHRFDLPIYLAVQKRPQVDKRIRLSSPSMSYQCSYDASEEVVYVTVHKLDVETDKCIPVGVVGKFPARQIQRKYLGVWVPRRGTLGGESETAGLLHPAVSR